MAALRDSGLAHSSARGKLGTLAQGGQPGLARLLPGLSFIQGAPRPSGKGAAKSSGDKDGGGKARAARNASAREAAGRSTGTGRQANLGVLGAWSSAGGLAIATGGSALIASPSALPLPGDVGGSYAPTGGAPAFAQRSVSCAENTGPARRVVSKAVMTAEAPGAEGARKEETVEGTDDTGPPSGSVARPPTLWRRHNAVQEMRPSPCSSKCSRWPR
mmetsp:Transcript_126272/g.365532  ORF Transcript_126272/g.365532 Transcript_126272/m.365532 type:complete len:217 (-) Transcript_126272:208-858(-)